MQKKKIKKPSEKQRSKILRSRAVQKGFKLVELNDNQALALRQVIQKKFDKEFAEAKEKGDKVAHNKINAKYSKWIKQGRSVNHLQEIPEEDK